MAPPTRLSSRLGTHHHSSSIKEDENAGVIPHDRPASRALRGRKETTLNSTKLESDKSTVPNSKNLLSTANVRKRILDDRTNNVKAINSVTNSVNPSADLTNLKKDLQIRKPSATTTKKSINVLLDTNPVVSSKITKFNSDREIKKRPSATKKANGINSKSYTTVSKASSTGPSHLTVSHVRRATSKSQTAALPDKETTKNPVEEILEASHVSKRARTNEPITIRKEVVQTISKKPSLSLHGHDKQHLPLSSTVVKDAALSLLEDSESHLKEGEEGWEDLDMGDEDDPLMVQEYVHEIYQYMKKLELQTLPDSHYMDRQNELTWKMRGVLVDWMIEVHSKFRLLPETLYLAINLMDRFLTKRNVALIKFQLVGVTALFVASKYEEVICPSVTNFLYMTDGGYDSDEILKAETYMLEMLQWDLRYPNPLNFLRRVSKADHYDIQSRTFAKYFMEISVVDYRLVAIPPSLLAATSIWLARKLLGRGTWDANLIHYSGYTQQEILPSAQIMLDYILRSGCKNLGMGLQPSFLGATSEGGNEHSNLFKKYATRKFFRVSELVREWAVNRYTYETPTGWEWDRMEEWGDSASERDEPDELQPDSILP